MWKLRFTKHSDFLKVTQRERSKSWHLNSGFLTWNPILSTILVLSVRAWNKWQARTLRQLKNSEERRSGVLCYNSDCGLRKTIPEEAALNYPSSLKRANSWQTGLVTDWNHTVNHIFYLRSERWSFFSCTVLGDPNRQNWIGYKRIQAARHNAEVRWNCIHHSSKRTIHSNAQF